MKNISAGLVRHSIHQVNAPQAVFLVIDSVNTGTGFVVDLINTLAASFKRGVSRQARTFPRTKLADVDERPEAGAENLGGE